MPSLVLRVGQVRGYKGYYNRFQMHIFDTFVVLSWPSQYIAADL